MIVSYLLGLGCRSFARATSVPNHWKIFLGPELYFLKQDSCKQNYQEFFLVEIIKHQHLFCATTCYALSRPPTNPEFGFQPSECCKYTRATIFFFSFLFLFMFFKSLIISDKEIQGYMPKSKHQFFFYLPMLVSHLESSDLVYWVDCLQHPLASSLTEHHWFHSWLFDALSIPTFCCLSPPHLLPGQQKHRKLTLLCSSFSLPLSTTLTTEWSLKNKILLSIFHLLPVDKGLQDKNKIALVNSVKSFTTWPIHLAGFSKGLGMYGSVGKCLSHTTFINCLLKFICDLKEFCGF